MKNHLVIRMAAFAAVFVLLDFMWSLAGNAPSIAEAQRGPLKIACLAVAFASFVALVWLSSGPSDTWVETAGVVTTTVAFSLFVVILRSALWNRGHFFHDADVGERLPALFAIAIGVSVAAGAVAVVFGRVIRAARGT